MRGVGAACRIAYLVVAVVAERDIHYATLGEMLHIGNVVLYSKAVLYAYHERAFALVLVEQEVALVAREGNVIGVA